MVKYITLFTFTRGFVFLLALSSLYFNPWVILPINSSPRTLTLVQYGSVSTDRIILRHYVNSVHIGDYVLELKVSLREQKPQTYELPLLEEGSVEVIVELDDEMDSILQVNYAMARDLYKEGLLIYLTYDESTYSVVNGRWIYERYVYFISGLNNVCYNREPHLQQWSLLNNAPKPKRFTEEQMGYDIYYYGWKENKWEVLPSFSN